MECKFTVNGQRFTATSEGVEEALRHARPERVQKHGVKISGIVFPVNQAFAIAFGLPRADFVGQHARRVFRRLGFAIISPRPEPPGADTEPERIPGGAVDWETIEIPPTSLHWFAWQWWEELAKAKARGDGIAWPRGKPGVYEARLVGEEERLVIGKSSDVARRVKDGLVRGHLAHPAGRKIRTREQIRLVQVRWAVTQYPAAVEEVLHQRQVKAFGRMPKYTGHT